MTTSLFTTTLMVSFLVVAAPHLIPCPVDPRTLADSADPTGENRRRRRRRRRIVETEEREGCTDGQSDEQRQRQRWALEEKLSARRECPVPKPGGLIGTVLGVGEERGKEEEEEEKERLGIMQRVEKVVCRSWGKGDDP